MVPGEDLEARVAGLAAGRLFREGRPADWLARINGSRIIWAIIVIV